MPAETLPVAPVPEGLSGASTLRNAERLVWIRTIALPVLAACLLVTRHFYGLPVSLGPVAAIVASLGLLNLWVWWRLRSRVGVPDAELFLQMLADLVALTGLLYFSGGAANPFVFFFLLPVTITAATLPQSYTWAIAVVSGALYTLLLLLPPNPMDTGHAHPATDPDLHVLGMWVGFLVIAGVIAQFVAAMAETVRQRDRFLAGMRENALRDERVVALATLAAGAAHELSTPLATMAVITGELKAEYPAADFGSLHRQLGVLGEQVVRCKEALSVISLSAGAARADVVERLPLDRFVDQVSQEVRRLRPGSAVTVEIRGSGPVPDLVVERTLRQALLNVLHNAVDASPDAVTMVCTFASGQVELAVADRGPGFGSGKSAGAPGAGLSTKEGGLGLGLFLTDAAVARLGGRLTIGSNPGGGTTVRIWLPMQSLTEAGS
jgi:two-component system, sensor histidine kinase RegB